MATHPSLNNEKKLKMMPTQNVAKCFLKNSQKKGIRDRNIFIFHICAKLIQKKIV
jgi:hypothetical protein